MSTWEEKRVVIDARIPKGFVVTYHELRGYDSPSRWYEAHKGRKKIGEFANKGDAIRACLPRKKR